VISYWSLTLNSFWAARAGDFLNDPDREIWYIRIRTAAIFCSVVLAVVYQSLAIRREQWPQTNQWDPFTSGFCFRTHDNSDTGQNLMWIIGLACYATYLAVFLLIARSGGTSCVSQFGTNIKALEITTIRRYMRLVDEPLNGLSGGNGWRSTTAEILKGLSYSNYSVVVVAGLVHLMVSGQRVSDFSYSLLGVRGMEYLRHHRLQTFESTFAPIIRIVVGIWSGATCGAYGFYYY
jgi:hypothetical protein